MINMKSLVHVEGKQMILLVVDNQTKMQANEFSLGFIDHVYRGKDQ